MSHKKFGPDRFSRFDVYWIQTNKQTDRQTDKPNLYIDIYIFQTIMNTLHYQLSHGRLQISPVVLNSKVNILC